MKIFFVALFLNMTIVFGYSQDALNFYNDYNGLPPPHILNSNVDYLFDQPTEMGSANPPYLGEYEIYTGNLFWYQGFIEPHLAAPLYCISYQYEIVSFPFINDCGIQHTCTTDCYARNLSMPSSASFYNSGTDQWEYTNNYKVNRITPLEILPLFPEAPYHALVSKGFNNPGLDLTRILLPHTAIKHTINFHCGSAITDPIVATYSFVWDNTRGRMRYYPFSPNNCVSSGPTWYDIIIRPYLLYNTNFTDYNDPVDATSTPVSNVIVPYKTLNYFPFSEINSTVCNTLFPAVLSDIFYTNNYNFIYPPPFTLFTSPLRSNTGENIAGYEFVGGNLQSFTTSVNAHSYSIDRSYPDLDLSIINPSEQVIYNPSEVTVTSGAYDLHFPAGYTFKTTLGIYPKEANVITDNISENGGPFADLRDVPVRTDLRSENASDPHDPTVAQNSVYASRYYLQSGSQLTVEPCVKIFDAAFDVSQGATLKFDDHSQMKGAEDKSNSPFPGRYKIKCLGGAVLRNQDNIQLVQNGDITQTQQLHYTAMDKIMAGYDVDALNTDQPLGNYELEANSNVIFQANNSIRLEPGFHAKQGSTFHAFCSPVSTFPICPPDFVRAANRTANTHPKKAKQSDSFNSFTIYPNPTSSWFKIRTGNNTEQNISIIDYLGNTIIEKDDVKVNETDFDLSKYPKGVYMVKVVEGDKVNVSRVVLM